jgi:hypothetical protein
VKTRPYLVAGLALLTATASAHPHFRKTVTAALAPGLEVTVTYDTTPANEALAQSAKVGEFVTPRRPVVKLGGELKAGEVTLPAGEYTLGAIKNGEKDWTMALYPGRLQRNDTPDPAKALKLKSQLLTNKGTAEHMLIDITPGSGSFEGKAVLTLHFGSLELEGVLMDAAAAANAPPRPPAPASTPRKP